MSRMIELDDDLCSWIEQHGLNVQEAVLDALRAFRGDIPFMDLVRLAAPVRKASNAKVLFGRDVRGQGRVALKEAEYAALSGNRT